MFVSICSEVRALQIQLHYSLQSIWIVSCCSDNFSINRQSIKYWKEFSTCWKFLLIFFPYRHITYICTKKSVVWCSNDRGTREISLSNIMSSIDHESFIEQNEKFIFSACRCFIASMLTMRAVCLFMHERRFLLKTRIFLFPEGKTFCLLVCFYDENFLKRMKKLQCWIIEEKFIRQFRLKFSILSSMFQNQRHWKTAPHLLSIKKYRLIHETSSGCIFRQILYSLQPYENKLSAFSFFC